MIKFTDRTDLENVTFERGDGNSTSLFITYGESDSRVEVQNYFTYDETEEKYVMSENTISIANNPNSDWRVFVKQWDIKPKPFTDEQW